MTSFTFAMHHQLKLRFNSFTFYLFRDFSLMLKSTERNKDGIIYRINGLGPYALYLVIL